MDEREVTQPTLPGIGPPECIGPHALETRPGFMGKFWRRCTACHVGVFLWPGRRR